MSEVIYDPDTCPAWPWRVTSRKAVIVLPEQGLGIQGHASDWMKMFGGQFLWLYRDYRSDGPTLWPKRWRKWLWHLDLQPGDAWSFNPLARWLYLLLDTPARWLMARWPNAWLAHDALCQTAVLRAYADRQMRLLIRGKGFQPRIVRWLAWVAVRTYALVS